ncbi:hypothetical protein LTR95_011826 [Oleoguttula sp. CCFEE 5521]
MSLTFKLLSLAIRTAAKPLGNSIKRQAKEHPGFRHIAVTSAQWVHRVDMRMRLGILHDNAAQERMAERERKKEEDKRKAAEVPIVRTEEEQRKYLEEQAKEAEKLGGGTKKEDKPRVNIRPLSEAKAIELGANFFSEAFIFGVAVGLLVWDSWRSRSKASDRRDEVKERLDTLEAELERIRIKSGLDLPIAVDLPKEDTARAWYNPVGWWERVIPGAVAQQDVEEQPVTTVKVVKADVDSAKTRPKPEKSPSARLKDVQADAVASQPGPARIDTAPASSKTR